MKAAHPARVLAFRWISRCPFFLEAAATYVEMFFYDQDRVGGFAGCCSPVYRLDGVKVVVGEELPGFRPCFAFVGSGPGGL